MLKNTDDTLDISNITGFLACDHHKQKISDIFNSWRNDSFNYMNTISDKMKANRTRKKEMKLLEQYNHKLEDNKQEKEII